ncbi:MAG: multidrug efflux system outer membrane protein [Maricaulis sp.]|jgi:multidrug efflux system outer membrane protein
MAAAHTGIAHSGSTEKPILKYSISTGFYISKIERDFMSFANVLVFFDKNLLTFAMPRLVWRKSRSHHTLEHRMQKSLLIIATALTTASCANIPAFQPDAVLPATPDAWSSAADGAGEIEAQDWVQSLGAPQLAALVNEALGANPGLSQSLARYDAARAGARIAGASRLPTLNLGSDLTRIEPYRGSGSDSFSLGLSSSWEADLWGRVRDGANAGSLDADAAADDLHGARLSVAGFVAKGWLALIEARQQSELAERDVQRSQNSLELTDRRFTRGLARSSDVRTARSALASSQAALASRQRAEAVAARNLETLLGRYPSGQISREGDFPQIDGLAGIGSPADLLVRRPDVRAAERRLLAAGLRADAAGKALFPRLSLSGGAGTGGADLADMFDLDSLVSNLTASLVAPIFAGGSLRAQRDQAEANARLQVASYVSTVLNAWQEAENAIYADDILARRVDSLQQAFNEAAEAESLVIRQYASGVATIFDLLNAQSRRISAESQYISARRDRATNRVDLYLAIAGDFSAAPSADPAAQTGE